MKKENFTEVKKAIDAAEARKAAAEKAVADNERALNQAIKDADAALEAEDMKGFQEATAKKAMYEFKAGKLRADNAGMDKEEYTDLCNSLIRDYTSLHRDAYGRLLSLAADMGAIVADLETERALAVALSSRLNGVHTPEDAFMISFKIPLLTARRSVNILTDDLKRGANG